LKTLIKLYLNLIKWKTPNFEDSPCKTFGIPKCLLEKDMHY
jgi:hypothetical protein